MTTTTGSQAGPLTWPLASGLTRAVFDLLEIGLIVCDAQGRVVLCNQAAQQELARARLICLEGGLLKRTPEASGGLDMAVRLAATRQRRSLIRLRSETDEIDVSLLPVLDLEPGIQAVLLMLGRRQLCSELGLELMANSVGLTLAERRVLSALVRERTPKEIARAHEVSLSTVRTQIATVRAKFGARNVEALLLRAGQVPPVASALRHRQAYAAARPAS